VVTNNQTTKKTTLAIAMIQLLESFLPRVTPNGEQAGTKNFHAVDFTR
jgi:hypothetical protein